MSSKNKSSCLTPVQLSSNSLHFYISKRLYLIQKAFDTQYWKKELNVLVFLPLRMGQEWSWVKILLSSTTGQAKSQLGLWSVGRDSYKLGLNSSFLLLAGTHTLLYLYFSFCIDLKNYFCNISGVRVIENMNWGPYFQLYVRKY